MFKASLLIALIASVATATSYVVPLEPGFSDGVSSIFLGKSQLFDWQIALSTLGACAVRIPHYHANTHEMLYVTAGTIAFVNVEANNTFTKGEASAGFLVEQPRGVLHVVYNPTCQNSTYNIFYAAANVTTYNVPYGINNVGNFSIDATYGKQYTYIDTRNSAFSRWYPDPALRYPNSADKGLWTYNPECVQRCGLKLPSTLIDIEKQPQAIKIGG